MIDVNTHATEAERRALDAASAEDIRDPFFITCSLSVAVESSRRSSDHICKDCWPSTRGELHGIMQPFGIDGDYNSFTRRFMQRNHYSKELYIIWVKDSKQQLLKNSSNK